VSFHKTDFSGAVRQGPQSTVPYALFWYPMHQPLALTAFPAISVI